MLRVDLAPGDVLVAESGSMVARHRPVTMNVQLNASPTSGFLEKLFALLVALLRKVLGGETFFVNRFEAAAGGSVWLAPRVSGAISHRHLAGETIVLTAGSFLASSGDVRVKMRFGGWRTILAKEGAILLEVSGNGDLWFNSYGAIHAIDVQGSYIVDTGHLVGFEGSLTIEIRAAGGGLMGLVASGEGLVAEMRGHGRVYIQSRNMSSLVDWVMPLLPG
ncbi:MAG: TIGR00266 family protein [Polyangiaceae bacterium]|nr:TIGR00266 family protein [Polyangiaceae bacterium]